MGYANTVRRVHEDPRVTKPYSEGQWAAVDALGGRVDELLAAADVRLTMGGEPTFSLGDTSTPQWGERRRRTGEAGTGPAAGRPAGATLGPGGVVHHGQGKWYPGEDLPRWNIAITWRTDGLPIWEDRTLLANPWDEPCVEPGSKARRPRCGTWPPTSPAGWDSAGARRPGLEDPLVEVLNEVQQPWGEARPENDPDPDDPALADEDARAALAHAHDRDRGAARGWVVPVFRLTDEGQWGTARWRPRRRHLFPTAGTSPMGSRLPLSSWPGRSRPPNPSDPRWR
ncbi:MAG: transglutaminase family protein [Micropruina sp.]